MKNLAKNLAKNIMLALIIAIPLFASAADPCAEIKKNFIGEFNSVLTSRNRPTERELIEITKWPQGMIFTIFVNGRPQEQYPIGFGEGNTNGKPTCLLSIGQAVLTSTFVDVVKGHFMFSGMSNDGPFKMEATRR